MREMNEPVGTAARGAVPGGLHVGIVHGVRRIHFVAAGESRTALLRGMAEYVATQVELQLYPEDAREINLLLDDGALEEAVRLYFERIGARWDREWLEGATVAVFTGAQHGMTPNPGGSTAIARTVRPRMVVRTGREESNGRATASPRRRNRSGRFASRPGR
jgi:hypothetical protein